MTSPLIFLPYIATPSATLRQRKPLWQLCGLLLLIQEHHALGRVGVNGAHDGVGNIAFLQIRDILGGQMDAQRPGGVIQIAGLGYDSIFGPGCVCSNIAQGVAALVVAIRTKDIKLRQVATSGGITALMGITEPVLYGVNLPKKYPLIAAMIGGGCGGLYAGLTQTHRYATGSSGLPAILLYIGEDSMTCFINIIIALIITAVVTAAVTWFLSLKFEKKEA